MFNKDKVSYMSSYALFDSPPLILASFGGSTIRPGEVMDTPTFAILAHFFLLHLLPKVRIKLGT